MDVEKLIYQQNIDNSLWYVKDRGDRTLSAGFKFDSGAKDFGEGYATGWNDCMAHIMDEIEGLKKRAS